jgi:hypothetical protein
MSLWTSSIISLLLLQTVQSQAQQVNVADRPVVTEEVAGSAEDIPPQPVVTKRDWYIRQAYFDVFKILSTGNTCSSFYSGPRVATTVLNDFVARVRSDLLFREISFQMAGQPRMIRDNSTGVLYRLFDRVTVNTNGSFYQRRLEPMRNVPADVGSFLPGSRPARALILLHELGHLIQGENGKWLIPDDGYDFRQSKANTLRVQEVCRAELDALN